ncbi:uncharacterized protein LOC144609922 [Rhinoraja longicauda]
MATYNRRLSDHAFRVKQDKVHRNTLEPECFPLSKSSSDTLFPRKEERQVTNPHRRKTISSVVSPVNAVETGSGYPCQSSCFIPQKNFTIIPLCGCFHMKSIPDPNRVSEPAKLQENTKLYAHSHTNSSSDIRRDAETMLYKDAHLGILQSKLVYRSCSDIICGYRENCCQDNIAPRQTTAEHRVTVPESEPGEMITKDSDQRIVINISSSETDNEDHGIMGGDPNTPEHQVKNMVNNVCTPMHQCHFMFTESSHSYPGIVIVQESGRQCADNCMKGGTITRDRDKAASKEGDGSTSTHKCAGHQSRVIPGLNIEETTPALCHPLPIPAIHLMPRLVSSVSDSGRGDGDAFCQSLPVSDILAFPRLVSSVSESGLDTRYLRKCHETLGDNVVPTATGGIPQNASGAMKAGLDPSHSFQQKSPNTNMEVRTRDMCTMTSIRDLTLGFHYRLKLKDAEVQTSFTADYTSVGTSPMSPTDCCLAHSFPEVDFEEIQKSPVYDVKWDDKGMTWEVYGASVDPEVLGLAIQKHLEIQIKQHEKDRVAAAEKTARHSDPQLDATCVLEHQPKEKRHLPGFRKMLCTLRHPTCCVRTTAVID